MDKDTEKILRKGLLEGYVGKSVRGSTKRAGFHLETSDYKGPEGKYHDEWAADITGAGQELVETPDGKRGTRAYGGGTPSPEKLQELGINKEEVIGKLVFFVNKLDGNTRLSDNAEASDGDWTYTYKLLESVEEISVNLGKEVIEYKGTLVFLHYHIIIPVK